MVKLTAYDLWRVLIAALISMLVMTAGVVHASGSVSDVTAVESEWQTLQSKTMPPASLREATEGKKTPEERKQINNDLVAYFLSVADEAAAFRQKNKGHARVMDAKIVEAKNLLKAALIGEKSQEARRNALVSEIEQGKTLPAKERFAVVAMAEHLLMRGVAKTPYEVQVAREISARYLMEEFPEEAGGYGVLLGTASQSKDPARIKSVTDEILAAPAPFTAKAKARILAGRYELIGKSLVDIAGAVLGHSNFFDAYRGQKVIVYTWATWSEGSWVYARQLVAKLPAGTLVIGYNLDNNVVLAQATAVREGLPGAHYFNEGGLGSKLALALKLNAVPLVYVTDEGGVIRDVAAQYGDKLMRGVAVNTP